MNAQQHCDLVVKVHLDELRGIWADQPDKVRMEILKSVIWTAADMHDFYAKVMKVLQSDDFKETLD